MIFGSGLAGALSTTKTISRAVAYQIFFLRKDILLHHAICSELPSYLSIMSKSGLVEGGGAKDINGHFFPLERVRETRSAKRRGLPSPYAFNR